MFAGSNYSGSPGCSGNPYRRADVAMAAGVFQQDQGALGWQRVARLRWAAAPAKLRRWPAAWERVAGRHSPVTSVASRSRTATKVRGQGMGEAV